MIRDDIIFDKTMVKVSKSEEVFLLLAMMGWVYVKLVAFLFR